MTNKSDNLAFLDRYVAAWNSHEPERVLALLASDCVYEDVALGKVFPDHTAMRGFLVDGFARIPELRFEVVKAFDNGDCISWEWHMTGRYLLPGADGTTVPSPPFKVRGASITEVSNGRVVRNRDYWNAASLQAQLTGQAG